MRFLLPTFCVVTAGLAGFAAGANLSTDHVLLATGIALVAFGAAMKARQTDRLHG